MSDNNSSNSSNSSNPLPPPPEEQKRKEASYTYNYYNITFPHPGVAHVEINRPEKLNAFIEPMWINLSLIFDRLSHDPDVRAVVLTGAGERAFSAGLDVEAAASHGVLAQDDGGGEDVARKANRFRRQCLAFQHCISSLERCEKPTITILHGTAYGLALDLALAADIRHCTATTRLSIKEVTIGLAADIGTLSRLPKAVGNASWIKEVALSGRNFDGAEALRVGLVSGLHADKQAAVDAGLALAALLASRSPVAVVGTKELLNWSRDRSVADGLRYTAVWNAAMCQTEDLRRALRSGLQRRTPRFEKL